MKEIRTSEGRLKTGDDVELFWRGWEPPTPAGCLLIVHGLAEHSGRYARAAPYFAQRGMACRAVDLRGHGLSGGVRAHVDRFEDYLVDVETALASLRSLHAGLPVFLLGHSLGGLIAIRFALDNPQGLAGAVVSSPLLAIHPSALPPALKRAGARVLSRIAPRLLMPTGLDPAALSRDRAVVDAYVTDPLVSHVASPRLYTALHEAMAQARARAASLRVPMLLMQSGADRLVDPEAAARWAQAAPGGLVQFVRWDGFYHEMLNEPERQAVLARAWGWLEERMEN